jgi:hypothetical protein
VRLTENGFAMAMNLPPLKRDKIADQLTWLANRDLLGLPEDRRHERIVPNQTYCCIRFEDGREHFFKIIDISISGAAIDTTARPKIGSRVFLGQRPARVVRLFGEGFALEFDTLIRVEEFGENIRL